MGIVFLRIVEQSEITHSRMNLHVPQDHANSFLQRTTDLLLLHLNKCD